MYLSLQNSRKNLRKDSRKNAIPKKILIGLAFAGSACLTIGCGSATNPTANPDDTSPVKTATAPAENTTSACVTINHPIYFSAPTAYINSTGIAFGKPEWATAQNLGAVTFDNSVDSGTVQGPYATSPNAPHPDGHLALQIVSTRYPYEGNQANIIGTVWMDSARQQRVLDELNMNIPYNFNGTRFQHSIQDVCVTGVSGETAVLYETLYFAKIGLDVKIANPASPFYNMNLPKILLEW